MPFFDSIGYEDKVPHAFGKFNIGTEKHIAGMAEILLRGPSPFTTGQRELIGAYVSGVNACGYCQGAHTAVAEMLGISPGLVTSLLEDLDTANIDENMKPVLRFVKKLTLTPSKMTQADADAVFEAGWSERALYDAIQVCAFFNFMNRFVEGLGLSVIPEHFTVEGDMLKEGYDKMVHVFNLH